MSNSLFTQILKIFTEKRCAYCEEAYEVAAKISIQTSTDIASTTQTKEAISSNYYALCPNCCAQLQRYAKAYCAHCGKIPLQENPAIKLSSCLHCVNQKLPWNELAFYALYESILEDIIKESKFYNKLIFTRTLADLVAPLVKEFSTFDFIVPMPLHKTRLKERGYNQCLEIVKYLNKKYHYPYNAKALTKVRHTQAQSTLSQSQRKVNLQNAFLANTAEVKNKRILLFDDVSTTGSTLFWASKALKEAGAKEVFVLYIAATKAEY